MNVVILLNAFSQRCHLSFARFHSVFARSRARQVVLHLDLNFEKFHKKRKIINSYFIGSIDDSITTHHFSQILRLVVNFSVRLAKWQRIVLVRQYRLRARQRYRLKNKQTNFLDL